MSRSELFKEKIALGPFNENYSTNIMFQIISAINYCHKMKIILIWNAKSKNRRF
jgi:serine/threonine protein kinase